MKTLLTCVSVFCFLVCGPLAEHRSKAQDWTQWGGPTRNFQVEAQPLPEEIKIREVWRRNLGAGYSAILVENGKLYTMYRTGTEEVIVCLNETTGETIWEHAYSAPLNKDATTDFGKGPNSTPILVGDSIIAAGFNSDLHCLDKSSGEVRWKSNLITDLDGTRVNLGYSQSPIIYNETLLFPVGGEGKGIVALNPADGSVIWSAQDLKNSYSTPMLATLDGLDQMIFVMTDEVVSVNPNNGKRYWTFPLTNQWSTHAFVPVWDAESSTLFVSSFRQSHALLLRREGEDSVTVDETWSIPSTGIGFTNSVIVNGIVIGSTGGSGNPLVTGIELKTGEILWRERGFGASNYVAAGDRIILLDEKGKLAIAKPTAVSLNVSQQVQVLAPPKAWTVPTLAGNKLFVRDQKEIVKFDLN